MASRTKYLVSDVLQIISDLRGESTVNTNARRIRAVSRAEQNFANRKYWATHLLKDQTVTGDSTSDYTVGSTAYPMRQAGISDLRVAGTGEAYRYDIVSRDTYYTNINTNSSDQVAYQYFDAANDVWKVHVNATPTTAQTVYYSYYWTPPARTLSTDSIVCHNPMVIAKLALADIYEGEDELNLADSNKAEAEQLITELFGTDNSPAVNQVVTMANHTPLGIGNY
jgi:hypothetical protein